MSIRTVIRRLDSKIGDKYLMFVSWLRSGLQSMHCPQSEGLFQARPLQWDNLRFRRSWVWARRDLEGSDRWLNPSGHLRGRWAYQVRCQECAQMVELQQQPYWCWNWTSSWTIDNIWPNLAEIRVQRTKSYYRNSWSPNRWGFASRGVFRRNEPSAGTFFSTITTIKMEDVDGPAWTATSGAQPGPKPSQNSPGWAWLSTGLSRAAAGPL